MQTAPTAPVLSTAPASSSIIRPGQPITDFLAAGPVISAELIPPRNGLSLAKAVRQMERIVPAGAQFVSVTHGAGGSLRAGTLPLSFIVRQQFGIESVAHLTCRDLNPDQLENALIDHHYLGVTNILALRGDPPGFMKGATEVPEGHYRYAYELVEQIAAMNRGAYRSRPDDPNAGAGGYHAGDPTNFCIGVAAYPDAADLDESVRHLKRKQDAGAHFAITQMVFSAESYRRFVDAARALGVTLPILPGLRILTSAQQAAFMEQHFGVPVPAALKARLGAIPPGDHLAAARLGAEIGVEACVDLCRELLAVGAPGIHVFVMFDSKSAADVITRVKGLVA